MHKANRVHIGKYVYLSSRDNKYVVEWGIQESGLIKPIFGIYNALHDDSEHLAKTTYKLVQ